MTYQDIVKSINAMNLFELREYAIKLARENKGLRTQIENLNEKLYKRELNFKGEVIDKEIRRRK